MLPWAEFGPIRFGRTVKSQRLHHYQNQSRKGGAEVNVIRIGMEEETSNNWQDQDTHKEKCIKSIRGTIPLFEP